MLKWLRVEGGTLDDLRQKTPGVTVIEERITTISGMARSDYHLARPTGQSWFLDSFWDAETFQDGAVIKHVLTEGEYIQDQGRVMWVDADGWHDEPETKTQIGRTGVAVTRISRKPNVRPL